MNKLDLNQSPLWLMALSGAALLGVLLLQSTALEHFSQPAETPRYYAPLLPDCDLNNETCQTLLPDGSPLSFRFKTQPVPLNQPTEFTLTTPAGRWQHIELDLVGVAMNMGFNRSTLYQTAPGAYQANVTLPVCIRNMMEWEARIMLLGKDGLSVVPVRFTVYKDGETTPDKVVHN